jgi:ubiquinone/menaquinone biosynthesis C-methylase UbiE
MLDLNQLTVRTTKEVILERIKCEGKDILDVGCGTGKTTRLLTRLGGRLTGLECGEAPLAAARSKEPIAGEIFLEGIGQDLPFADGAFDAVCFFFSLHHVPTPEQLTALKEAHRVLRGNGVVYIFEPVAQGSSFRTMQPVDDETEVRAAAQKAITQACADNLFSVDENFRYLEHYTYADFEAFKVQAIMVDAARAEALKTCEDQVRKLFVEQGVQVEAGHRFEEPVHFIKLQKS